MATKTSKSQSSFLKPVGALFRRFHLLIFFVLIVGCLSVAIILINQTLTKAPSESYTSSINAGSIDQATLERIQSLHPSSQPSAAPTLPPGRSNPFSE